MLRYVAAAVALLGLTYGLTAYPLLEPDEGRNAEVAREMAAGNDYVVPHLEGLPYADKPVLFFAVEAAFMEVLGPTVLAARLPPLVFTLATLALIGWWAQRRSGARAGWVAAVAAASSPLTVGFARTVIFDAALTFFVAAALVAFYEAIERRSRTRSPAAGWEWAAVGWAAVALAVLTKGPIGLALPLMVALPYALWRRAGRALGDVAGLLLFAALLLPWLVAMSRRVPDFWPYVWGTETLFRLATPALGRTGPVWYFVPILLAGSLPWIALALGSAGPSRSAASPGTRDPYAVFLLAWLAIPLVFFSLSQSKRPQYVLPLVPAVALLAAHRWKDDATRIGARWAAGALAGAGALLLAAPSLVPELLVLSPAIAREVRTVGYGLGTVALIAAAGAWRLADRREAVLCLLALPVAAIAPLGMGLMRQIGRERSSAELARAIADAAPQAQVVAVGTFPLSLPFYLRRPVLLASATGRELTSNYLLRRLDHWRRVPDSPLRPLGFWRQALDACERWVFVVPAGDRALRGVLAARTPLLVETPKYAAYGPCGAHLAAGP